MEIPGGSGRISNLMRFDIDRLDKHSRRTFSQRFVLKLHRGGVMWCNHTQVKAPYMAATTKNPSSSKDGTRASVTFPAELYAELERIAEQKKVSVAWVVRDAAEKYVADQYPLFRHQQ
jgi:hypothetical protein